jgi:hypothetical protein
MSGNIFIIAPNQRRYSDGATALMRCLPIRCETNGEVHLRSEPALARGMSGASSGTSMAETVLVIPDDILFAEVLGRRIDLHFPERSPSALLLLDHFGMLLQELIHEDFEIGNVSFVHRNLLIAEG